ncbi:transposase [Ensifer sp. Root142]|nr:transposase [Ensifer sp. Root142]
MRLITEEIRAALITNGRRFQRDPDFDPLPLVKLFTPDAAATWLIAAAEPEDPDLLFGLCDLGVGFPELGSVLLSEIQSVRGRLGLRVERDLTFKADRPISAYAKVATVASRIVA